LRRHINWAGALRRPGHSSRVPRIVEGTMTRTLFPAVLLLLAAAPLAAQEPEPRVDRIGHVVAIVGDSVILNFDLQQAIIARAAAMRIQPPEPGTEEWEAASEVVLEDLIAELLVVQAALRDTTLNVPEDQVAEAVQRQIDQSQQQLGGAVALEQELRKSGRTLADFREALTTQYRRRELVNAYHRKALQERRPPRVTDEELRAAFEQQLPQLQPRPATITFQQVIVRTEPSDTALQRARQRADSVF